MTIPKESPFVDPYTYPGSAVLKNIPGKTDQAELDAIEYDFTFARRREFDQDPITGPFDFKRLLETHRRLFQDVYDWAGQIRTVDISKGSSSFHHAKLIPLAAGQTFEWLHQTHLLNPDVEDTEFVRDLSDLMEKLNFIHPFREGNGRALRAFVDQVAEQSGRTLSWRNTSPEDQLRAAVNAFRQASGEPFRSVIEQALRPPIDGLSPLDREVYLTSTPVVTATDSEHSDYAERQEAFYRRFPELRETEPEGPGPTPS